MKRPELWSTVALVAIMIAVGAFVVYRYAAKPFFARDFQLVGHGFLVNWELCRPLNLDNGTYVYFDYRERVLLVVPQKTTRDHRHQIQWVIERAPVSDCLRIYETEDEILKEIEWRRDCVIIVNSEGVPTYTSMSVREFKDAFSISGQMKGPIEDIVRKARADQTKQQPATSEPAQP